MTLSEETKTLLFSTVQKLTEPKKGILNTDESTNTIGKIFNDIQVPNTKPKRREWRQLLFSIFEIEKYISGVIVNEETLFDKAYNIKLAKDVPLVQNLHDKNVVVGVELDQGLIDIRTSITIKEKWTKGLDTLPERAKKALEAGARFAKWRCVYEISVANDPKDQGHKLCEKPSNFIIIENARVFGLYAKICQHIGLVPIIEAQVLMEGTHSLEDTKNVQSRILNTLFQTLEEYEVWLPGVILNTNFVVSSTQYLLSNLTHAGKEFTDFSGFDKESYDVCNTTLDVLSTHVPQALPAVFFLSGELTEKSSTNLLKKINQLQEERSISKKNQVIQNLSFSFGKTLQFPALYEWAGKFENLVKSQQTFLEKCKQISEATHKHI